MSKLSLNDFKTRVVEGTTNGTANTRQLFRHAPASDPQAPTGWMVLYGSVYVPYEGDGGELIDVRSTKTSEKFKLLIFYS